MIVPFRPGVTGCNISFPAGHGLTVRAKFEPAPDVFVSKLHFGSTNQQQLVLLGAIGKANKDEIIEALSADVDLTEKRRYGNTPLHLLATSKLSPTAIIPVLKKVFWLDNGVPNMKAIDALEQTNDAGKTVRALLIEKFKESAGAQRVLQLMKKDDRAPGASLADLEVLMCRFALEGLKSKRSFWGTLTNERSNAEFMHQVLMQMLHRIDQVETAGEDVQNDIQFNLGKTLNLCRLLLPQKNDGKFREIAKGADIHYNYFAKRPSEKRLEQLLQ